MAVLSAATLRGEVAPHGGARPAGMPQATCGHREPITATAQDDEHAPALPGKCRTFDELSRFRGVGTRL